MAPAPVGPAGPARIHINSVVGIVVTDDESIDASG